MRLVVAVLLFFTAGCAPHFVPADPDFSQIRGAVKELKAEREQDGKKEMVGFCPGVLLNEHTLLTAAHCDVQRDIYVGGFKAIIVKKDEQRDLMLLNLPRGMPCPCVSRAVTPALDAPVYAVGFPMDKGQVLTEGRYGGSVRVDDVRDMVLYTAPVTFGNSGGGVFAYVHGEWMLVAIVSRGTVANFGFVPIVIGHLNVGAGYESITSFMERT